MSVAGNLRSRLVVVSHFMLAVGEPYVIKLNASLANSFLRQRRRENLNRCIQQLENALAGRHGALQDVVFVAQVLDGTEEALRVLHKSHEHADGYSAAKHAESAEPDHHGNGHARKDFHHRVIERVGHDGVFESVHVLGVDLVKAAVGALFAVEKLQHHHAGDVLLQVRVDAGNGGADAAVGVAHRLAEDHRRPEDQGQHGKGDEREPPAHAQHDDQDPGEHEDIFKDRDHAGGEHFIQRVHVRGDARDQAADRVLVIEADVHVLQVAEDLAAEIEHHFLSRPLHQVNLRVFQSKSDQQQHKIEEPQLRNADQRLGAEKGVQKCVIAGAGGGEIFVDGGLGEEGAKHVTAGFQDDRDQRDYDLPFIGA